MTSDNISIHELIDHDALSLYAYLYLRHTLTYLLTVTAAKPTCLGMDCAVLEMFVVVVDLL